MQGLGDPLGLGPLDLGTLLAKATVQINPCRPNDRNIANCLCSIGQGLLKGGLLAKAAFDLMNVCSLSIAHGDLLR